MTSLESTTLTPLAESTVWPCVLGFIWVAELSTCLPKSEFEFVPQERTGKYQANQGCPVGYYLHMQYRECLRKKYHGQQAPGRIKHWWESVQKPKTTHRPPTRWPKRRPPTEDDGEVEWWGYHHGWGSDVTHP